MKIVADSSIPFVEAFFSEHFTVELLPHHALTQKNLSQADILICRANLKVNQTLLENTSIKLVASPTSGFDHFDISYLDKTGITWFYSPGCNATAVAEYVIACIATLRQKNFLSKKQLRTAIIGVGHVGQAVTTYLKKLDIDIVAYDPPRTERDLHFQSASLSDLKNLDLLCLHPALTKTGKYPSYHLVDEKLLAQQQDHCVVINASRGEILDPVAIKKERNRLIFCLDVFENEPNIDKEIFEIAMIATPHIAGHTLQSKWRGVEALYQQLCKKFKIAPKLHHCPTTQILSKNSWEEEILENINPLKITETWRAEVLDRKNLGETFFQMREKIPSRREIYKP